MKLKSKLFVSALALTLVLGVAVPASAQTTAELQAQIASLLAMINQLNSQLAAQGGTTVAAGTTFTKDLTVGSNGADVTALQQMLVSKGYMSAPASYGYFGAMTKAALVKYQTAMGITPASGYFGPLTRAKANAGTTTTTGGTTTTTTGSISTPGAEGTLTVTSNSAGLVSTVYEGDSKVAIYGFNVEAKNSDISIQRVKVDLGSNSKIYTKGYSRLYVTDGSNVLASSDLNSSTVVKESGEYYVTITGFNYVVPKGSKKQLVLKADVMSSIDSSDMSTLSAITPTIPANGVRGTDGAGIDQYAPTSALTGKSVTFSSSLTDSATLKMSLNTSSPKKSEVVATSGTNENEYDKLPLMAFDLKAEKDDVKVTDLNIEVAKTGSGAATATTVYLFDGSTEIDNASIVGNRAVFSDLDYTVPRDTTKTLTVKADIRSANGTVATFTAAASTTGVAIATENNNGDSVTESGSATGYGINVVNVGPEVTLVSKSITTNGAPQTGGSNNIATSTLTATFNVQVKAVGGDIMFGTTASGTPMFASSTTSFKVYRNGAYDALISSNATSTSYAVPSGVTTSSLVNSFTLSEGNTVTIPVTFQIVGRNAAGSALTQGLYSVGLEGVQYQVVNGAAGTVNFMAGETDWRTADVSFP